MSGVVTIELSLQGVSSPALTSIKYLVTPTSSALNGGAHERLTDLDVKATVRGLPGGSKWPKRRQTYQILVTEFLCVHFSSTTCMFTILIKTKTKTERLLCCCLGCYTPTFRRASFKTTQFTPNNNLFSLRTVLPYWPKFRKMPEISL